MLEPSTSWADGGPRFHLGYSSTDRGPSLGVYDSAYNCKLMTTAECSQKGLRLVTAMCEVLNLEHELEWLLEDIGHVPWGLLKSKRVFVLRSDVEYRPTAWKVERRATRLREVIAELNGKGRGPEA